VRSYLATVDAGHQFIGQKGGLPWQPPYGPGLPQEMNHFLETTKGGILIVGRRTFEERGKPYPHARETIVVSKDAGGEIAASGATVAASLVDAVSVARAITGTEGRAGADTPMTKEDIWICGGRNIYAEAIDSQLASCLLLTSVEADFEGSHRKTALLCEVVKFSFAWCLFVCAGDVQFPDKSIWEEAFPVEVEEPRTFTDGNIKCTIHHRCSLRHWLSNNTM